MFELENYDIFFDEGVYKIKYWFKNLTNKELNAVIKFIELPFRSYTSCLLYTSPSPRD